MSSRIDQSTIEAITSQNFCISCGACTPVCPQKAIHPVFNNGIFFPTIDHNKCTQCALCLKLCPSNKIDVQNIYGKTDFLATSAECYTAYTRSSMVRKQGTSGGIVTTLVDCLLKSHIYEKAYLLTYEKFDGKNPAQLLPVTLFSDIFRAAKSKYIPASIEHVISDIINHTIGKSIIVATPCQVLAIHKSLEKYHIDRNNILIVGLFCDMTLNYNIYSYYKKIYGNYDELHFRDKKGNGWPGDTILVKKKQNLVIEKKIRMALKPYFQLNRCRYCFDKLNQLADISCGDCYISSEHDILGKSSIIVRSSIGKSALHICKDNLHLSPTTFDSIKHSQKITEKITNIERNLRNGVFQNFPQDILINTNINPIQEKDRMRKMELGSREQYRAIYREITTRAIPSQSHSTLRSAKKIIKKAMRICGILK